MAKRLESQTHFDELTVVAKICLATLFAVFPAHLSCSSTSQSHIVKVAEDRYGGEVECLPNESKSFLLCINKPKVQPGNPQQPVRFMVFDITREEAVLEDSVDNGDVQWLSNDRIGVRIIPEVVSEDGETGSGYIFDIHTRIRKLIPAQGKRE
jgi:hypothetical protein